MTIKQKLQERLEGHIADTLLTLGLGAITALAWFADSLLPAWLIQSLGTLLSAQILIGLSLTVLLLASWIAYLRTRPEPPPRIVEIPKPVAAEPKRRFLPELGYWEDLIDHNFYCAKCEVTPLSNHEAGKYCVKCHYLYKSPEFLAKEKRRREEENERVRRFNQSLPDY